MPKLNDYIGSLVSSITNARVMSDLQTVKVAEEYAKHNLLKHFSIPRMRIDDVEMTIPIVLDEINEKIETEYEPIDFVKFNAIMYKEGMNNFNLSKIPRNILQKLKSDIAIQTEILEQNIRITKNLVSLKNYSKDLTLLMLDLESKFIKNSGNIKRKMNIEAIPNHLEKILSDHIKIRSQKQYIENLNVIVESHKISEQNAKNIIYIKLKISENGMEWNRSENNDGEIEENLLPE